MWLMVMQRYPTSSFNSAINATVILKKKAIRRFPPHGLTNKKLDYIMQDKA